MFYMNKEKKEFLPDKKILFFILFVISVSIIVVLFFSDKNDKTIRKNNYEQITLNAIKGIGKNVIDTDFDGISDFEEEIDGTDINNPDTDGDGISDFIEKKLGTDPKIKRTKDPIVKKELEKLNKKSKNSTEKINSELIKKIFEFRGKEVSKEEYTKMIKNIYRKNLPRKILKNKYSLEDIEYSDEITIKQYKNSFIVAGTYIDESLIDEKLMLSEYLARPTETSRVLMQASIDSLKLFEKKVSEIKVPDFARKNHLKYLNSLNDYLNVLQNIVSNYKEDPALSFLYYQKLDITFRTFAKNVLALNKLYFN